MEDIPDTQDIHMISVLDSTDSVIDIRFQDLLVFVCRSVIGCLKHSPFIFSENNNARSHKVEK